MTRASFFFICIVMIAIQCHAVTFSEEEARRWCDKSPLSPVEGIWEYPDDGARVLIQEDVAKPGTFTLTIISTADCRLQPGDVIGRLYPTINSRQFRLEQMTRKNKLSLTNPFDCTATLSSDKESLQVKSPKATFKINLNTLLPRFWRIVRLSVKKPTEDLPAGLLKIYPGYDHNGSMHRKIRVL